MRHQQPTREPFREIVVRVAGRRMRNLNIQHLHEPHHRFNRDSPLPLELHPLFALNEPMHRQPPSPQAAGF